MRRSIDLKDLARRLISIQPYIEKGWEVVAVDLLNNNVHLFHPKLPYRKRNKYKKLTKRERELFKDLTSRATLLAPRILVPQILEGYSDILV